MGWVMTAILEVKEKNSEKFETARVVEIGKNSALFDWLTDIFEQIALESLYAKRNGSHAYELVGIDSVNDIQGINGVVRDDVEDLFYEQTEELERGNQARIVMLTA